MRIAILYAGRLGRFSGTEERVLQVAKELANHGVQVILSGASQYGTEIYSLKNLKVIFMPSRILKLPSVLRWLAKLIADGLVRRYDVIQVESFSLARSLILFLLLRPFGKKFIIVFHDKWFERDPRRSNYRKFYLALQRLLLLLFDACITPGLSIKKWFEELHGEFILKKMIVIPNGAPKLDIKQNNDYLHLRKMYGLDRDAFLALFFGSMTFKPNYEAAIELYKMSGPVSKQFEEITGKKLIFVVAGLGSQSLPATAWFVPLGFIDKLDYLLSLPDVIVLPHLHSYSGPHVKTIYAFLSKKPVLATEDAVKDMPSVAQGRHFLLFDISEPKTLLDALLSLYNNRQLRKALALNAHLYAKKFSWEKISMLHLKLYSRLLAYRNKES